MSKSYINHVRAAHVYRDGEITCTVLIEKFSNSYSMRREGSAENLSTSGSPYDIELHADMYLAGFMAGYDEGVEHASKQEHAGHDGTDDPERTTRGNLRVSGRGPAFPSERRNRADDEGAGEGIDPD